MHPGVAFILYLAVGCVLILMFLLLCVRVSVFMEDTCPIRFCLRRKQRKLRKTLIRDMLFPDDRVNDPESPRPAPPSDENITADIICQPYIYRDAYSTGLTELSGLSYLANLPLTVALSDGNPSDAVVTNYTTDGYRGARYNLHHQQHPLTVALRDGHSSDATEPFRVARYNLHQQRLPQSLAEGSVAARRASDIAEDDAAQSLPPPDYVNATNTLNSNSLFTDTDSVNLNDEAPPPSYYECVPTNRELGDEQNGNLTLSA